MNTIRSSKSLLRKIILSLLVAGFFSGLFHLDESSKLKEVYCHFLEHRETSNTNLITFLYQHFISPHATDSGKHLAKHQQFPFKTQKSVKSHWDQVNTTFYSSSAETVQQTPWKITAEFCVLISKTNSSWKPPRTA